MKASSTLSWESTTIKKLSDRKGIGRASLTKKSSRELVEFYWTNRKRFSGGYRGFPAKAC